MIGFFSKKELVTQKDTSKKILNKDQNVNFPKGEIACKQCKLYKDKTNPKLKAYGLFKKKILVIGSMPSQSDDNIGKPFNTASETGKFLHNAFNEVGLDLYKDCLIINACDCYKEKTLTERDIRCCLYRKERVVQKYKPRYILLLGTEAKKSFYSFDPQRKKYAALPLTSLRGFCVPDKNSNAYIFHSEHPSFVSHYNKDMQSIFKLDLLTFASIVKKKKRPTFINFEENIIPFRKYKEVKSLFQKILQEKPTMIFDYESSSYRYHEKKHKVYLVSIQTTDNNTTYVVPLDFPRNANSDSWWNNSKRKKVFGLFKKILEDEKIKKVAQNIKHEIQCSHYLLNAEVKNVYHDTMIAAHVINTEDKLTNLKTQGYLRFGQYHYGISDNIIGSDPQELNKFATLPFDVATKYCAIDSKITNKLIEPQINTIHKRKLTRGYKLFLEGVQAFSVIERNGIKINLPLAKRLYGIWGEQIEEFKDKILSCKEAKKFNKVKGRQLKFEKKLSDDDLRTLLFDIHGIKSIKQTKTGASESVDNEALLQYADKSELVSLEMQRRKLDKMRNTYLSQFLLLQVDGFLYPSFNLHLARSLRSSSDSPNFQNIPKRTEEAKEIRQIFISRWGNKGKLAEVDYGSMEVRIIACVTKDGALIAYLVQGGDMHGDWAEILFKCKKKDIDAGIFAKLRYIAKNHWVFPLFYGSFYKSVARSTDIFKIFEEYGLDCWCKSQTEWENHLKECEAKFWKQFKGVREWQNKYIDSYKRNGFIKDFAWGFERHGYLTRNKIYNFPIQGPAYHCLQYTINNLWRNNFYNFQSPLCGQIHDALFWDCLKTEFNTIKNKVHYLMTEKIREDNPWIIVPLIDEWSKGDNWANMEDCNYEKIIKEN
jgi:DNA polymerase-1